VDHDLTRRAEQAALGAMIADRQLAARLAYLEPEDFTDPRRQWVFRTIRQLSATQQHAPGNWSDLIAKTAGRWVTRKYLDELAAACPDPDHGPAYGAMLVQAAVYRQARGHADQMDDHAIALRAEGSRLSAANAPGAGQAARLGTLLADVARAVRGHTAALAPAAPGPADAAGPGPGAATPADQREELVLSAVLQEHPQAGQILSYLPAAAFTSPACQEIFRAARRLNQSGRLVDELTVSWELATRTAVTAILSPESASQPQVPSGYIRALAGTGIGVGPSPVQTAHELDVQLRYKASRDLKPAVRKAGAPPPVGKGHSPQPSAAQTLDAPGPAGAVPLIRPQNAAEARPAGPEPER
jgi:DnaB-like helicase N terminal domain